MASSFNGWGSSWGSSWGPISSDPNAMFGNASIVFAPTAIATAIGQLSGAASFAFGGTGELTGASGTADVKVSWLAFDTSATPVDVKVSWLAFDTAATPCDVRVSWVCLDTAAKPSGFIAEVELKRWYIKRNKQILVFNSAQEADDYIESLEQAEKAIEAAKKTSRRARQRLRNRLVKAPIQTVDIDLLSQAVSRFDLPELPSLIQQQDFERLMQIFAIAQAIQEDEDDIELLLLA